MVCVSLRQLSYGASKLTMTCSMKMASPAWPRPQPHERRASHVFDALKSGLALWLLLAAVLVAWSTAFAKESTFAGEWNVTVDENSSDQPWWYEVKYPATLRVRMSGDVVHIDMVDQYGYECSTTSQVMLTNAGRDLVFAHCGAGTKNPESWSPIHHTKIVEGQLQGVVTTNRYLFRWTGVRVDAK